ncbi:MULTISPECIES: FAD/NAD(P)-binding protein [unclassified Leucobacter]|uniref:FAD/NAD(P)-binding protein n=1 Tax=unclassified Leucobacter TaxID=2621730 RepID=UPI000622814D|nr:FAD/NAD(P)-binding protein [Leucobacter sp. Ag1]KKI22283.1 hypothetical protein XM48_02225 [Leucobacter sp. Ag1]
MSGDRRTADEPVVRIVGIGAGPAAAMLLERIAANRAELAPGVRIELRLVDPHPPGGGRIWRSAQSPLLKLNSMLADVAFFTDASCRIEGPVLPGPTLAEWVREVREGAIPAPAWADAELFRELAEIGERDFPTRRLNNAYLSWAVDETLRRSGAAGVAGGAGGAGGAGADSGTAGVAGSGGLSVEWVRDRAVDVEPGCSESGAPHRVRLASGAELTADLVVHALGHSGTLPSDESIRLGAFADRHGLGYIAPAFTADVDLDGVPTGADVIVRGMGLAAIDLVVLLTEGRGGRFARDADGSLGYRPSGREPILHLGSRRGVPYRSKITTALAGDPVRLEYLGTEFHATLAERAEQAERLDFERDVWPLVVAELTTGYYRELSTGHPGRVTLDWVEFAPRLRAALDTRDPGVLAALAAAHVPDPEDRFDLSVFDRPLAQAPDPEGDAGASGFAASGGFAVGSGGFAAEAVQDRVRAHIAQDLRHRTSPEHSATLALFLTALHVYLSLAEIPGERWNARSRVELLPGRWHAFFSYLASGPPGHRLEELLALADSGIVRFLGADVELVADEDAGMFRASGSAAVAGGTARSGVSARVLIDAWLPEARASRSDDPLLRRLVERGVMRELAVVERGERFTTGRVEASPEGRLPGAPRQYAVGPFVAGLTGGAFTRPGFDSLPFRVHDRCARAVLADAVAAAARAAVPVGAEV